MAPTTRSAATAMSLLAMSTYASAQFGPPSGGNPYGPGGGSGSGNGNGNPFSNGGFGSFFFQHPATIITAHAVCATLAFAFFFPVGGILIRLASFRGAWLAHGIFQVLAYIVFAAAVGLGVTMANALPAQARIWHEAHPIIGLVAFGVLFLQPWLGLLHHFAFKKHSRRVFWSYAHIWIGRAVILLGIVNGGLGLQLAQRHRFYAPSNGVIVGYSVGAAAMYLVYILCALYGERKRSRVRRDTAARRALGEKHVGNDGSGEQVQYA